MSCPTRLRRGKFVRLCCTGQEKLEPKLFTFWYAMMLGLVNQTMEVYGVKLQPVNGNFEMEADVTKVEKP